MGRRIALLLALAAWVSLLCGCGGEDPAKDLLADYNGTWYFAPTGVKCTFDDGRVYREDKTVEGGMTLMGIYVPVEDHVDANLVGVGGVSRLHPLYVVTGDDGQVLCETIDGTGTVYFYRDALVALAKLDEAEPSPSPSSSPSSSPPTDGGDDSDEAGISQEAPEAPDASPAGEMVEAGASVSSQQVQQTEDVVWVSKSGSKYHSTPTCSGMKEPLQLSREKAEARGYTPCKRCH